MRIGRQTRRCLQFRYDVLVIDLDTMSKKFGCDARREDAKVPVSEMGKQSQQMKRGDGEIRNCNRETANWQEGAIYINKAVAGATNVNTEAPASKKRMLLNNFVKRAKINDIM